MRRSILVGGGFIVYLGGIYATLKYFDKSSKIPKGRDLSSVPTKKERNEIVDDIATSYDSKVATSRTEWLVGIQKQRKSLIQEAEGKVLEVAGGTGKNFIYYTTKCKEVIFVDSSEKMVQTAMWKFKALVNKERKKLQLESSTKVNFMVMDVENLNFRDQTFDCVVDTYGICSFDNPVEALKEMKRVCKPNGKILLLEHGRSRYHEWLNSFILDKYESEHTWKYGCTWNRDIDSIVSDAGLFIISKKSIHLGTNQFIIASPSST